MINHGPYYSFNGHSSFVKNVCWAADDSRVISAGGSDRSMMQWSSVWKASDGARTRQCALAALLAARPCSSRPPLSDPNAPPCPSARVCAGYVGYRQPGAPAGGKGRAPALLPEQAAAAAVPTLALAAPAPAGDGAGSAAAEEARRAEQARAVALLEQQMQAIEQQQQSLRAELSRLKK